VRKSSVSVAQRRTVFENSVLNNSLNQEISLNPTPGKRKYRDEDYITKLDLPSEEGFNWIEGKETTGKRVKLDQHTIVKKRLEYFKVLSMDVDF
jgi:hypothetical protein